ncbi:MAG: hypothetical protein H8E40_00355 [Chloroflexi bacterium]|nr:hypothetical protein [Chloroflexota bacterium]
MTVTERAIDNIRILDGAYPRDGLDKATIESYRAALTDLPPILITASGVLVDGAHRLQAYRLEGKTTIQVEMDSSLPEEPTVEQVLILSAELNARHGKQLTMTEKARVACALYGKTLNGTVYHTSELAAKLGASERIVRDWTRTQRENEKTERQKKALELYLQCFTQQEIAEKLGWSRQIIGQDLDDAKNGKTAENGKPDPLRFADVWSFSECDKRFGHDFKGRIPGQIVQHTLYYYTEVFDIIVDPMAGSGTTVDVCKLMLRRYRAYDLNPIRSEIQKHNMLNGIPEEAKGCNLIFVDPPYWDMNDGEYEHPEGSLSSLTLEAFLAWEAEFAMSCKTMLAKGGLVAFLIQSQTGPSVPADREYIDHAFEVYQRFAGAGFTPVRRISVPMSTETLTPQHIEKAKEERRMLGLVRDLLVFRKQ